ncbi:MAG: ATP-binding protein [Alphaproteobacteria bacterium]|nr:ATP-binding protein [Alphaproteobacteria bacterium]
MDNENLEKALQAQKLEALGRFAGGIAHDFNNILSIIEGYTHIAVKQLKEGSLTPEQLQKIVSSTQRGAGLTRQLLAFARQKVDMAETTELTDTLQQQHVLLRPLLGEKIYLYLLVPEKPLPIAASADQVMQIIMNLALNARDAMPDGGELGIICRACPPDDIPQEVSLKVPEKNFAHISFIDSGTGIPSDIISKIFDPFFTTKQVTKGTGLGLSVVYGIIEQVKGHITVQSRPGQGTTFDVYLPLAEDTHEVRCVESVDKTPQTLAGRTILVAEDEPELRDVLAVMLEDMNMHVLTAANGNHALLVQEEYDGEIDFLLTDVVMPEMDGVHLGSLFHSVRPDSNVIYMSGYPFWDGAQDMDLPSDAPFIGKPLRQDTVRRVLERALQRRDARIKQDDATV